MTHEHKEQIRERFKPRVCDCASLSGNMHATDCAWIIYRQSGGVEINALLAANDELEKENAELRKDRDRIQKELDWLNLSTDKKIDAAIDSAAKEGKP